ncbi:duf788 domain containing protein [Grosmannia clavigera kw1407]|uniref:Duf788 domain containing protein n=1 Tax=Grosmannia clavigera (strain kw1407 / UAMH 11150) TaxID=655863 RepID=F0XGY6_GROCL|nr:duf788 domain containing protein [Grosmannia clavigera kw1407]EFX02822.1 duf788 domain containing protein [Grosmannia clavigera kw1407]
MAQKAKKDRAKANTASLNSLHIVALAVNVAFLAFYLFFRSRSLALYLVLSTPSFISELMLERTGRPTFDPTTGSLRSSGEDLSAAGLTEYMFDVIWVTWGTVILVILFGNKLWLIWAIVPAYGAYKAYGLLGMTRQMAGLQGMANNNAPSPASAGSNRKQRRAA